MLELFGYLSGFFAVGKIDVILLSYPLYIIVANIAVVLAILFGEKHKMTKK